MGETNQRVAYGNTLKMLGKDDERIVVLDADLGGSTMGKIFEAAYPERHFEMGIAEANMTSVAAGLAQTGRYHLPTRLLFLPEEGLLTRYGRLLQLAN